MNIILPDRKISVFSVVRRDDSNQKEDIEHLKASIRLSDEKRYEGMLLFESNKGIEPWVFGQLLLENSINLSPFIAINPVYMHPFSAAKKILTLTELYKRKLYLNFIAGTSQSDLNRLGDNTDHSQRYKKLAEYISIILRLLSESTSVTMSGAFYKVNNLGLSSQLPADLLPGYFIAGASEEAQKVIQESAAGSLGMAKPSTLSENSIKPPINKGIHFGILTREDNDLGELSKKIFPSTEHSDQVLKYSMQNTDARWKAEMYENLGKHIGSDSVYTLSPFGNLKSDCPYFIGSYEKVSQEIYSQILSGITSLVIEVPTPDDFHHIEKTLQLTHKKLLGLYNITSDKLSFSF